MNKIIYKINQELSVQNIIRLYLSSGINRPVNDSNRIELMYQHSNLVISAWDDQQLVGVARSLTDLHYCCYLSDLAVAKTHQRQGIGKELIRLTKEQVGPESMLLLLSASNAISYYQSLKLKPVENGYIIPRDF